MSLGLSLYIDVMRFGLALIVFLAHLSSAEYTGGFLWRVFPFAQPAVIGFFVLSGFVIAYVAENRERDGFSFTISRISRLYSVVIPALILTAICDSIGWSVNYPHYLHAPLDIGTSYIMFRYLVNFFMAASLGGLHFLAGTTDFQAGTNGPFWSLSNEIVYYIGFGIIFLGQTPHRYLLLIVLALIAGLHIIILAPLWILGVVIFKLVRQKPCPAWLSIGLFSLSCTMFVVSGIPSVATWCDQWRVFGRPIFQDYTSGVAVAMNIFAASGVANIIEQSLYSVEKFIRWLGLLTFPLYLCHRPLLQFITGFPVAPVGNPVETIWIVVSVFAVVVPMTVLSEKIRKTMRVSLNTWVLVEKVRVTTER